ncbi:MAG: MBL fold metallo-hydrolase [Candidatus Bathyarchaeia archaeon]
MAKLHRLNSNVYEVTKLQHVAGIGVNAGFIMSQNHIIHIDAGMTVQDGQYLLNQSGKKVTKQGHITLILTHHHSDHIFGMRVFKEKEAKIIAHKNLKSFLHIEPHLSSVQFLKHISRSQLSLWSKDFLMTKLKPNKH